jgi:hypothetical protein
LLIHYGEISLPIKTANNQPINEADQGLEQASDTDAPTFAGGLFQSLLLPFEKVTLFGGHPKTEPRLIQKVHVNGPNSICPEQHV